jgi:hypothetical protein
MFYAFDMHFFADCCGNRQHLATAKNGGASRAERTADAAIGEG